MALLLLAALRICGTAATGELDGLETKLDEDNADGEDEDSDRRRCEPEMLERGLVVVE